MKELDSDRWQLPDGVSELLPAEARHVERLRRAFVDNCSCWGYELVSPPLIEYLDSLLTGTGEMLDLQTFKIVDQTNGRTLGVRADMTAQVARMDAHALQTTYTNRLCYTGTVLRARSDGVGSSRTPLQFGAELFGHAGPASDAEIILLMLETALVAGLKLESLLLDLGHIGVYQALIQGAQLDSVNEARLFDALVRGSRPEVNTILEQVDCQAARKADLLNLMSLAGNHETVLQQARDLLTDTGSPVSFDVGVALECLHQIIEAIQMAFPNLDIRVDLADVRGYRYHTGTLYTLYDSSGVMLASGGRYDSIGEAFGNARPATGFSGDLVSLARLVGEDKHQGKLRTSATIRVTANQDPLMWQKVRALRAAGSRVIIALDEHDSRALEPYCDRQLVKIGNEWTIEELGQTR